MNRRWACWAHATARVALRSVVRVRASNAQCLPTFFSRCLPASTLHAHRRASRARESARGKLAQPPSCLWFNTAAHERRLNSRFMVTAKQATRRIYLLLAHACSQSTSKSCGKHRVGALVIPELPDFTPRRPRNASVRCLRPVAARRVAHLRALARPVRPFPGCGTCCVERIPSAVAGIRAKRCNFLRRKPLCVRGRGRMCATPFCRSLPFWRSNAPVCEQACALPPPLTSCAISKTFSIWSFACALPLQLCSGSSSCALWMVVPSLCSPCGKPARATFRSRECSILPRTERALKRAREICFVIRC
jgi:hypothetical protein